MYLWFIDLTIPRIILNIIFVIDILLFCAIYYESRRFSVAFYSSVLIFVDLVYVWIMINNSMLKELLPHLT